MTECLVITFATLTVAWQLNHLQCIEREDQGKNAPRRANKPWWQWVILMMRICCEPLNRLKMLVVRNLPLPPESSQNVASVDK